METANGDRILVADFATERARLGQAYVMRLARHPSAHDAGLSRDKLAVLLVAQSDGFLGWATTTDGELLRQIDRGCGVVFRGSDKRSLTSGDGALSRRILYTPQAQLSAPGCFGEPN